MVNEVIKGGVLIGWDYFSYKKRQSTKQHDSHLHVKRRDLRMKPSQLVP